MFLLCDIFKHRYYQNIILLITYTLNVVCYLLLEKIGSPLTNTYNHIYLPSNPLLHTHSHPFTPIHVHTATFMLDALMDRLPCSVQAAYLHVMVGNKAAIQFYERSSFSRHRRLPMYYSIESKACDAYTYVRPLNQPPRSLGVSAVLTGACISGGNALVDFVRRLVSRHLAFKPCMLPQRLIYSFHRVSTALHWLL